MRNILLPASPFNAVDKTKLVFNGLVPLVNGTTLATLSGLGSVGTSVNPSAGFLAFEQHGKEFFVARQPIRRSISWNQLNAVGAVDGTRVVTIDNKQYKVRLMTGGNGDPSSGAGGEWNEYMYAVSANRPANYDGPVLADYTLAQLGIGDGSNAISTLCKETHINSAANCVRRGRDNLTYYAAIPKNDAGTLVYWRPVLEAVE